MKALHNAGVALLIVGAALAVAATVAFFAYGAWLGLAGRPEEPCGACEPIAGVWLLGVAALVLGLALAFATHAWARRR